MSASAQSLRDTMTYRGQQRDIGGQVTVGYGFAGSGSLGHNFSREREKVLRGLNLQVNVIRDFREHINDQLSTSLTAASRRRGRRWIQRTKAMTRMRATGRWMK